VHQMREPARVPPSGATPRWAHDPDQGRQGAPGCLAGRLRRCGRRFVPVLELLGLSAYQRRSVGVTEMAAAFATEVAYAKAARLRSELAGIDLSARSVRRDTLSLAPTRIGPETLEVPVLLLDGTGVRAGDPKTGKNGVELHLAVGLVAGRRDGGRRVVEHACSEPPSGSHGRRSHGRRWPSCSPGSALGW